MIQQLVHAERKVGARKNSQRCKSTIARRSRRGPTRGEPDAYHPRCCTTFDWLLVLTPTHALPLTALMEVSCSRGKRTVKVNGESYLMPACLILCTRKGGAAYLGLSIPLLAGSCTVNGKTVSKQLAIKFSNKTYLTKEWLLVLR